MIVTAIVAMDRSGVIGDGQKMPWHLPRDLRRFRELTWGKPIVMGRRTLETLKAPLPGRLNIVLTHNADLEEKGFRVASSVERALQLAQDHLAATGGQETMIIGGGQVYEATSHLWGRLLLTVVEGTFRGSTRFPLEAAERLRWRLVDRQHHPSDEKNPHAHWFLDLHRVEPTDPSRSTFDLSTWLNEAPRPDAD